MPIRTDHLVELSRGLGVPAQQLLAPLPGLSDGERVTWETTLLWDRLYPSLEAFLLALAANDRRALARLVDRAGLFRAARIAGSVVWEEFHTYRQLLRPTRRDNLQKIWNLRHSQMCN